MLKKNGKEVILEGSIQTNLFQRKEIRKIFHNNEWWFVVSDVINALLETPNPSSYLKMLRARDEGLKEGWSQIVTPLPFQTQGGVQKINCVNVEGIFRIMQAVPSKRAEPFKRWLARVGYERIQEYQNPEIAIKRAILNYKVRGYSDDWIHARIRTIQSRKELTDEWQDRGVRDKEYGILTDVISQETFDIKTKKHKEVKRLEKHHALRDHMTNIELILTMLGEKSTTMIARKVDAFGFMENERAAKAGGAVAGSARKNLETEIGESVISRQNYLNSSQAGKSNQIPTSFTEIVDTITTSNNKKDNE